MILTSVDTARALPVARVPRAPRGQVSIPPHSRGQVSVSPIYGAWHRGMAEMETWPRFLGF